MKIFTIEEANALLPNVRTIVGKIQRAHRRLAHYREDAKKASEAAERGGGGFVDGLADAAVLTELTAQLAERARTRWVAGEASAARKKGFRRRSHTAASGIAAIGITAPCADASQESSG